MLFLMSKAFVVQEIFISLNWDYGNGIIRKETRQGYGISDCT